MKILKDYSSPYQVLHQPADFVGHLAALGLRASEPPATTSQISYWAGGYSVPVQDRPL